MQLAVGLVFLGREQLTINLLANRKTNASRGPGSQPPLISQLLPDIGFFT